MMITLDTLLAAQQTLNERGQPITDEDLHEFGILANQFIVDNRPVYYEGTDQQRREIAEFVVFRSTPTTVGLIPIPPEAVAARKAKSH